MKIRYSSTLLGIVVSSVFNTAYAAEFHSQAGIASYKIPFDDPSLNVKQETNWGLSARGFLYWSPHEGSTTNYNLGLSFGYISGSGDIELSAAGGSPSPRVNLDSEFQYAAIGITNGVVLKLSKKNQFFFDLGLDMIPLNSKIEVTSGSEAPLTLNFNKAIGWHVQSGSYIHLNRNVDLSIAGRYELLKLFIKDQSDRIDVFNVSLGLRYKFVEDERDEFNEGKKKRRSRVTQTRKAQEVAKSD